MNLVLLLPLQLLLVHWHPTLSATDPEFGLVPHPRGDAEDHRAHRHQGRQPPADAEGLPLRPGTASLRGQLRGRDQKETDKPQGWGGSQVLRPQLSLPWKRRRKKHPQTLSLPVLIVRLTVHVTCAGEHDMQRVGEQHRVSTCPDGGRREPCPTAGECPPNQEPRGTGEQCCLSSGGCFSAYPIVCQ